MIYLDNIRFRKGFTLVELLVVVVIVGMLSTIAIPQYLKVVEKARVGEAKAKLSDIIKGVKMYNLEQDMGNQLVPSAPNSGYLMTTVNDYVDLSLEANDCSEDGDWCFYYGGSAVSALRKQGKYNNTHLSMDVYSGGVSCAFTTHPLAGC